MRACVLRGVGAMEVAEVPRPDLRPGGVVVRVEAVGLCGTDTHIFSGEANYNTDERRRPIPLAREPQILGHEIAGVVADADPAGDLRPGDRVVLDQGLNCVSRGREPRCEYCRSGDSHQCLEYREHGITGLPGGLAEYIAVPATNAVRLESDIEAAEAAFTEPLGCVVHASESLGRGAGARYRLSAHESERRIQAVLIFGAGPAGLLFVQYLREVLAYDGTLLVAEPNARKRALAGEAGGEAIDPGAEDVTAWVTERTRGRGVELVIDASGAGAVFATIPTVLRKQGTLLLYAHGHGGVDMSLLNSVQFLEPTLLSPVGASGGFEPDGRPSTYVKAARLLEAGRIRVAPLLTHRYRSFDDVPRALARDYRAPEYVKGVVCPD